MALLEFGVTGFTKKTYTNGSGVLTVKCTEQMVTQLGLLHNPNGPAHIQLSKDVGWKIIYSIKGRGVSYLEFKDQYMVTHLREYEPIDAQKAYYYWKGLDLSYEFV